MTIILALVGLAQADDQNSFGVAPWNGAEFVVTEDGQSVHVNLATSVGKCNGGKLTADAGVPVTLFGADGAETAGAYTGEVLLEWTPLCRPATRAKGGAVTRTGSAGLVAALASGAPPQQVASGGGLGESVVLFRVKGAFDWDRQSGFATATSVEPMHADGVDGEVVLGAAWQSPRHSTLTLDAHARVEQAVVVDEDASLTRGETVFGAPAPLTGDAALDLRYEYLGTKRSLPGLKAGATYDASPFVVVEASWAGLVDELGAVDLGASTWKASLAGGVKSLGKGSSAGAGVAVLGTMDPSPARLVPILLLTGNLGGTEMATTQ